MKKRDYNIAIKKLSEGSIDVPFEFKKPDSVLKGLESLRQQLLIKRIEGEKMDANLNEKIACVAHDLKTPIATIAGYAECIQDGIDDKDYPTLIINKTNEIIEQVGTIVSASKESVREEDKRLVEAKSFLMRIIDKIVSDIKDKPIELHFRHMHKGYVYINVHQIFRVVQNLITNAVKYNDKDRVVLIFKGSLWGDKYFLSIKDNGIGINKSDAKRVFEQFFRADRSRSGKNSGLGLFICKKFVEEHGGKIIVKSNGKSGSEFVFSLPILGGKAKKSFSKKFEELPQGKKILLLFLLGWFVSAGFRFSRYHEKKCPSTLIAGILSILLVFPFWTIDFVSEAVYNRIVFLAD